MYECVNCSGSDQYVYNNDLCVTDCDYFIINSTQQNQPNICTENCNLWYTSEHQNRYCSDVCNENSYMIDIISDNSTGKRCVNCNNAVNNSQGYLNTSQQMQNNDQTYYLCQETCQNDNQYVIQNEDQYCVSSCSQSGLGDYDSYTVEDCQPPYGLKQDNNGQNLCERCDTNQFLSNYTSQFVDNAAETVEVILQCLDECKYRGFEVFNLTNGSTVNASMCYGNEINGINYINYPLCPNQVLHNTEENVYICQNCTDLQFYNTLNYRCQTFCWDETYDNDDSRECIQECDTEWYELVIYNGQLQPNCTNKQTCDAEPYHVRIVNETYATDKYQCSGYCGEGEEKYMNYDTRICSNQLCDYLNITQEIINSQNTTLYICETHPSERCMYAKETEEQDKYLCTTDCQGQLSQNQYCVDQCSPGYYINNDSVCTQDICQDYYEFSEEFQSIKCLDSCDKYHGIDNSYISTAERCVDNCTQIDDRPYTDGYICREKCSELPNIYTYEYDCVDQCPEESKYINYSDKSTCQIDCNENRQIYINQSLIYCIQCDNVIIFDGQDYLCQNQNDTASTMDNSFQIQISCEQYGQLSTNVIKYYQSQNLTDTLLNMSKICVEKCPLFSDNQFNSCTYQCQDDQIVIDTNTYCQLCNDVTDGIYKYIDIFNGTYKQCYECDNQSFVHSNLECNQINCSQELQNIYHDIRENTTFCVNSCTDFITNYICTSTCQSDSYTLNNNQRFCDNDCQYYITPDGSYNSVQQCVQQCTDLYPFIINDTNICLDNCGDQNLNNQFKEENGIRICTTQCDLPLIFQDIQIGNINAQICDSCDEMIYEIENSVFYCGTTQDCQYYQDIYCYGTSFDDRNTDKCQYFTKQNDKYVCGDCQDSDFIYNYECLVSCPEDKYLNQGKECLDNCNSGQFYQWSQDQNIFICLDSCTEPLYHGYDNYSILNERCESSCTEFNNFLVAQDYQCQQDCSTNYHYWINNQTCVLNCGLNDSSWIIYNNTKACIDQCESKYSHLYNYSQTESRNYCIQCNDQQILTIKSDYSFDCTECQSSTILSYKLEDICIQVSCSDYNDYQNNKYQNYVYYSLGQQNYCYTKCQIPYLFVENQTSFQCLNICSNDTSIEYNNMYYCTDCSTYSNNIWWNQTLNDSSIHKQCTTCELEGYYIQDDYECTNTCERFKYEQNTQTFCVYQCPDDKPFSVNQTCQDICNQDSYINQTYYQNDQTEFVFCDSNCSMFIDLQPQINSVSPCVDICANNKTYEIDNSYKKVCLEQCDDYYGIDQTYHNTMSRCVDQCSLINQDLVSLDKQCLEDCPDGYDVVNKVCTLNCTQYYDFFSIYCLDSCQAKYIININLRYCADCSQNSSGPILTFKQNDDLKQQYYCSNQCQDQQIYIDLQIYLCVQTSCYNYSIEQNRIYNNLQYQTDNNTCIQNCDLFINDTQLQNNNLYCSEQCNPLEYQIIDQLNYCRSCDDVTNSMYYLEQINQTQWKRCQLCEYTNDNQIYWQVTNECSTNECFLYQNIQIQGISIRQCITECQYFIVDRQCSQTCNMNGFTYINVDGENYMYCDYNCTDPYKYIGTNVVQNKNQCVDSCRTTGEYVQNGKCVSTCSISYIFQDNELICDSCTDPTKGLYINSSLSNDVYSCQVCPQDKQFMNRTNKVCMDNQECIYQNQTSNICETSGDQQHCRYFYDIDQGNHFRCVEQCDADDFIKQIQQQSLTGQLCVDTCDLFINQDRQCLDNCQQDNYYTYENNQLTCQSDCQEDQIKQIDTTYHSSLIRCLDSCTDHSSLNYNQDGVCVSQCQQPKEFVDSETTKICVDQCQDNTAMAETLVCVSQCPAGNDQYQINNMTLCASCPSSQYLTYDSNDSVFQLKYVRCTDCSVRLYKRFIDYLDSSQILFCTRNTCGFTAFYIQNYEEYNIFNQTSRANYCQQNCTNNQYLNQTVDDPIEYQCVSRCDDDKWQEHDDGKFYCEQCEIFRYDQHGAKECTDCNQTNDYLYEKECNDIMCWQKGTILNVSNGQNICQQDCNDGIGLQNYTTCDVSCQYVKLEYVFGKLRNVCTQQCDNFYVISTNNTICYNQCPQEYQYIAESSKQCLQQCNNLYYYINQKFTKKCVSQCQQPYITQGQQCILCPVFYSSNQCKTLVNKVDLTTMQEQQECQQKTYVLGNSTYCVSSCQDIQMLEYDNICNQYCPYPTLNNNSICVQSCTYFQYINDERTCVQSCDNKYVYIQEYQSNLCVESCQNTEYIYETNNNCSNQRCTGIYKIQDNHIICLDQCDTQITNNLCQDCNEDQFIDNNQCVNDCGDLYIENKQCVSTCTNNYYYQIILDKYCQQQCQTQQFSLQQGQLIQCLDNCPYNYQYYSENRTCLQQCNQKLINYELCVDDCPQQYYQVWDNQSQCNKCTQYKHFIINNQCVVCLEEIVKYIEGNLECTLECYDDEYLYKDGNLSALCTDISCDQSDQLESFKTFKQLNINKICTKTCEGYLENNVCVPKCEVYTLETNDCGTCDLENDYYTIKYTNFYCTECTGQNYYTINNYCAENINCKDYNLLLQVVDQVNQCVEECDSLKFIIDGDRYVCSDTCDTAYIVEIKPFTSLSCQDTCSLRYIQSVEDGPSMCLEDCQTYLSVQVGLNYNCTTKDTCLTFNYIVYDSSSTYRCTNVCNLLLIQYYFIDDQQYNLCLTSQSQCTSNYYKQTQINNRDILVCQTSKCQYYSVENDTNICKDECQDFKIFQQLTLNYLCVQECSEELPYILSDNLCQSDCSRYKFSSQIEGKNNSYKCEESCNKTYIGDTVLSGVYVCLDSCRLLGESYLYSEYYTVQLDNETKDYYHCVLYCPYHSFALNFICETQCQENQYVINNGIQKICVDQCEQGQFYQIQKILDIEYKLCVTDCENLIIEHEQINECTNQEDQPFDWLEYAKDQCQN